MARAVRQERRRRRIQPHLQQFVPAETGLHQAGGAFTATFKSVSGRTYFLERTSSLGQPDWTVVDQVVGTGDTMVLTDLNPSGTESFYRARVQ